MRQFQQVVFDRYVNGTTTVYSDAAFNDLLGQFNQLSIQACCSEIAGTSPTLTVNVETSGDQQTWHSKFGSGSEPISGVSLTAASNTHWGKDTGSTPSLGAVRLTITLVGTSPAARIRIFACGRS
ncbi:MAG: hypothetical protein HY744_22135 [Deltaproteobacteria bacterium]|nr:hypothetical protein [Deltaproteobacteria bacterium]